jgi:hypothetical protein
MRISAGLFSRVVLVLGCFSALPVMRAEAAYTANFDTTGSAADFATFNGESNTSPNSVTVVAGTGGNNYLLTSSTAQTATGTQMRFHVAPSLFEGAEIAIPTGVTGSVPRTEARLTTKITQITGGDDLPAEYPFTQFGFAEFDPNANTADYASKVIVQITNTLNQVNLSYTTNNAGGGNTSLANFNIPGGTWVAGDQIELQVTQDQARLLYNGSPMLTAGPGTDYQTLPAGFFANNFAAGNQFIPFFGVIRGSVLEAGDTLTAGFDDINARNSIVGGGQPGDANGDGNVDMNDAILIANHFRDSVPQSTLGDLDGNGLVNFADFRLWKTASGFSGSIGAAMAAAGIVPEPASGVLAILGLVALGERTRRRKQA